MQAGQLNQEVRSGAILLLIRVRAELGGIETLDQVLYAVQRVFLQSWTTCSQTCSQTRKGISKLSRDLDNLSVNFYYTERRSISWALESPPAAQGSALGLQQG